jgi:hypothetical protein
MQSIRQRVRGGSMKTEQLLAHREILKALIFMRTSLLIFLVDLQMDLEELLPTVMEKKIKSTQETK